jgi:hypothetical protein
MLSILATQMIPFIERCVLIIFPLDQLQKAYGLSQSDAAKLKDNMRLDHKLLLEPVIDLLPAIQQQPQVETAPSGLTEDSKVVDNLKQSSSSEIAPIKEEEDTTAKFEIGAVQQEPEEKQEDANKEETTEEVDKTNNNAAEETPILTEDAKID